MSLKGIPKNTDVTPLILSLVELLKPKTYIELGVKHGYTFNQVSPLVERAIGVDSAGFKGIKSRTNIELFTLSTSDFIKQWKDPVDFVFMDASHEKYQILNDFEGMFPYVRPYTGLVCIHDTYPIRKELAVEGYCGTAWDAAKTIRELLGFHYTTEIVTIPGPWFGMSIIRKVNIGQHLEWMALEESV